MNNNKKILKRSSAAFLAALNIFNFAGGSSKALNPWNILLKGYKAQANENEVKELEAFLGSLEGINFENVEVLKDSGRLLDKESIKNIADFYKLKGRKVLFIDLVGAKIIDKSASSQIVTKIKSYEEQINGKFVIYRIKKDAQVRKGAIERAFNSDRTINFIDVDDISVLKPLCKSIEETKNLQEQLKTAQDKVQKAENEKKKLQKELDEVKGKSIEYFYINEVLRKLVKVLKEESGKDLQENSDSLAKVQEGIDFEGAKFKLVGNDDDFLGKFKFKYNEKGETFSINELIDELNKLSGEEKLKTLKPIVLNDIKKEVVKADDGEGKKEDVLDTEAYGRKLEGYIDGLNKIIATISSMPVGCQKLEEKIKIFESNENTYKNKVKEVLGKLDKEAGTSDTLEKQLNDISTEVDSLQAKKNTAVKNLETANSKARKLGVAAVLG